MEMTALMILGAVLVIWYFGATINSVVKGTGEMASEEFKVIKREQKIRLHKERANQTDKIKELSKLDVMSDEDFDEFFAVLKEKPKTGE